MAFGLFCSHADDVWLRRAWCHNANIGGVIVQAGVLIGYNRVYERLAVKRPSPSKPGMMTAYGLRAAGAGDAEQSFIIFFGVIDDWTYGG